MAKQINPFTGLEEPAQGVNPFTGKTESPQMAGLNPLNKGAGKVSAPTVMNLQGDIASYERYNVPVLPGLNINDMRAEKQSNWEKFRYGYSKGMITMAGAVVENTLGYVNGIAEAVINRDFSRLADNTTGRNIDKLNAWAAEYMPHYYTQEEMESGPSFTANFVYDKLFNGLGYAVGSLATFYGTGGIGLVTKGTQLAAKAGMMGSRANRLYKLSKAIQLGEDIGEVSAKTAKHLRRLDQAKKLDMGIMMSHAEASVEAREILRESKEAALEAMAERKGVDVFNLTAADRREAEKRAKSVAMTSYGLNIGILATTNLITFGKHFLPKYPEIRPSINGISGSAKTGKVVDAWNKSNSSFAKRTWSRYGKEIMKGNASEALQEGGQWVIGDAAAQLADKEDRGAVGNIIDWGKALAVSTRRGIDDPEAQESMILGFLIGGIMGGGRAVSNRLSSEFKTENKNRALVVAALNSKTFEGVAQRSHSEANKQQRLANMQKYLEEGNHKGYRDEQMEFLREDIKFHQQMGSLDMFIEKLEDTKHMSEEDFKAFHGIPQEIKVNPVERVNDLLREVRRYEEIRKNVDQMFPNQPSIGMGRVIKGKKGREAEDIAVRDSALLKELLIDNIYRGEDRTGRINKLKDEVNSMAGSEVITEEDLKEMVAPSEDVKTMEDVIAARGEKLAKVIDKFKEATRDKDPSKIADASQKLVDLYDLASERNAGYELVDSLMNAETRAAKMLELKEKERKEHHEKVDKEIDAAIRETLTASELEQVEGLLEKDTPPSIVKKLRKEKEKRKRAEDSLYKTLSDKTDDELRIQLKKIDAKDEPTGPELIEYAVIERLLEDREKAKKDRPSERDEDRDQDIRERERRRRDGGYSKLAKQVADAFLDTYMQFASVDPQGQELSDQELSVVLEMANIIQKVRNLDYMLEEADKDINDYLTEELLATVDAATMQLEEMGIEMIDMTSDAYDRQGMKNDVDVIELEADTEMEEDEAVIQKVKIPQVTYKGKTIQKAQVVVRQYAPTKAKPKSDKRGKPKDPPTYDGTGNNGVRLQISNGEYARTKEGKLIIEENSAVGGYQPTPGNDKNQPVQIDRNFVKTQEGHDTLMEKGVELELGEKYKGTDGKTYQSVYVKVPGTDTIIGYLPERQAKVYRPLLAEGKKFTATVESISYASRGNFTNGGYQTTQRFPFVSAAFRNSNAIAGYAIVRADKIVPGFGVTEEMANALNKRRKEMQLRIGQVMAVIPLPNGDVAGAVMHTSSYGPDIYGVLRDNNLWEQDIEAWSEVLGIAEDFRAGENTTSFTLSKTPEGVTLINIDSPNADGNAISMNLESASNLLSGKGKVAFRVGKFETQVIEGRNRVKFVNSAEKKQTEYKMEDVRVALQNALEGAKMQVSENLLVQNTAFSSSDGISGKRYSTYRDYLEKKVLRTDLIVPSATDLEGSGLPFYDIGVNFILNEQEDDKEVVKKSKVKPQKRDKKPTTRRPSQRSGSNEPGPKVDFGGKGRKKTPTKPGQKKLNVVLEDIKANASGTLAIYTDAAGDKSCLVPPNFTGLIGPIMDIASSRVENANLGILAFKSGELVAAFGPGSNVSGFKPIAQSIVAQINKDIKDGNGPTVGGVIIKSVVASDGSIRQGYERGEPVDLGPEGLKKDSTPKKPVGSSSGSIQHRGNSYKVTTEDGQLVVTNIKTGKELNPNSSYYKAVVAKHTDTSNLPPAPTAVSEMTLVEVVNRMQDLLEAPDSKAKSAEMAALLAQKDKLERIDPDAFGEEEVVPFRLIREGARDTLINAMMNFGIEIVESEKFIADLASKRMKLDTMDNEQVAEAMATTLATIFADSGSQTFRSVRLAIESSPGYKARADKAADEAMRKEYRKQKSRPEKDRIPAEDFVFSRAGATPRKSKVWQQHVKNQQARARQNVFVEMLTEMLQEKFAKELTEREGLKERDVFKIRGAINDFLDIFRESPVAKATTTELEWLDQTLQEIVDNTFKEPDYLSAEPKPGYKKVDLQEAFDGNPAAHQLATILNRNPNLALTGSISMAPQGSMYRKGDNLVHDLDYVNKGNNEEAGQYLLKHFPEAIKIYSFAPGGTVATTWLVPPKGYAIRNMLTERDMYNWSLKNNNQLSHLNLVQNSGKVLYYELIEVENKNNPDAPAAGTFELEFARDSRRKASVENERKDGVEAIYVDFFANSDYNNRYMEVPFRDSDGKNVDLTVVHYATPMEAKISMARAKDIWDIKSFEVESRRGKSLRRGSYESIDDVVKWGRNTFGRDVVNVFNTVQKVGDATVHGYMKNAAIHLWRNAAAGTGYHEGFHLFFRTMTTPEQREVLYADAVAKYGEPTAEDIAKARRGQPVMTDAEARLLAIEEKLADEFMTFKLLEGKIDSVQGRIKLFFKRLLAVLKAYVFKTPDVDTAFHLLSSGKLGAAYSRQAAQFAPGKVYMLTQYAANPELHEHLVGVAVTKMVSALDVAGGDRFLAERLLGSPATADVEGGRSELRNWFLHHSFHIPTQAGGGRLGGFEVKLPIPDKPSNPMFSKFQELYDEALESGDMSALTEFMNENNIRQGVPDSDSNGNPMPEKAIGYNEDGEFDEDQQGIMSNRLRTVYDFWHDEYNELGGRAVRGFRSDIKDGLRLLGYKIFDSQKELTDSQIEDLGEGADKIYSQSSHEVDLATTLGDRQKRMLSRLTVQNPEQSPMGFETLVPIKEVFNEVMGAVHNSFTFKEMRDKLANRANEISSLKSVLSYLNDMSEAEEATFFSTFAVTFSEFTAVIREIDTAATDTKSTKYRIKTMTTSSDSNTRYYKKAWLDESTSPTGIYVREIGDEGVQLSYQLKQDVAERIQALYEEYESLNDGSQERQRLLAEILWTMGAKIAPSLEEAEVRMYTLAQEYNISPEMIFANTHLAKIIEKSLAPGKDSYINVFEDESTTMTFLINTIISKFEGSKSSSFGTTGGGLRHAASLPSDFDITTAMMKSGELTESMTNAVGSHVGKFQSLAYVLSKSDAFRRIFYPNDTDGLKDRTRAQDEGKEYDAMTFQDVLAFRLAIYTQRGSAARQAFVDTQGDRGRQTAFPIINLFSKNQKSAFGIFDGSHHLDNPTYGETFVDRIVTNQVLLDLHRMYVSAAKEGGEVDRSIVGYHTAKRMLMFQTGGQLNMDEANLFDDAYSDSIKLMSDAYAHMESGVPMTKELQNFLREKVDEFHKAEEASLEDIIEKLGGESQMEHFMKTNVSTQKTGYTVGEERRFLKNYITHDLIGRIVTREYLRGGVNFTKNGADYNKRSGLSSSPGNLPFIQGTGSDPNSTYGLPPKLREITIKDIFNALPPPQRERLKLGLQMSGLSEEQAEAVIANFDASNDTDAQGIISIDTHKYLQQSIGNWPPSEEAAYIKYKSQPIGSRVWEGAPIPFYKTSYDFREHVMINGYKHRIPISHKNSYIVLTDELAQGITRLENLVKKLESEDIHIANTESAKKLASFEPVDIDDLANAQVQEIDSRGLKFAQFIKPKKAKKVTFGRQPRRNLIANVEPTQMYTFGEEDNATLVNGYDAETIYMKAVVAKLNQGHAAVMEELGFTKMLEAKTEDEFQSAKLEMIIKIRDLINEMGVEEDLPQNMIESLEIKVDENGNVSSAIPFGFPGMGARLSNIIMGMFRKGAYLQKLTGVEMVQFAEFGGHIEDGELNFYDLATNEIVKPAETIEDLDPTDPDYYEKLRQVIFDEQAIKAGQYKVLGAEVDIRYDVLESMGIDMNSATDAEIDQALRRLLGYRIPQQGKASMLMLRVRNILPKHHPEAIRVPKGVTKLMGSDFDIDKMFVIFPEARFNKDTGVIEKVRPDYESLVEMAQSETSQEEWDNLDPKVINNIIFDTFMAIQSNVTHLHESLQPLDIEKKDDPIYRAMEAMGIPTSVNINLMNTADVLQSAVDNMLSMSLRGIYADGLSGRNILETIQTRGEHLGIDMSLQGGIFNVDGKDVGAEIVKYTDYTTGQRNFTTDQVLSNYLGKAVDSVKDPIQRLINDNALTAPLTVYMISTGFSAEQAIFFLNVPIIRQIVEEAMLNNNSISQQLNRYDQSMTAFGENQELSLDEIKNPSMTSAEMLEAIAAFRNNLPAPKSYNPAKYVHLLSKMNDEANKLRKLMIAVTPDNIDKAGTISQHSAKLDAANSQASELFGFKGREFLNMVLTHPTIYPIIPAFYNKIEESLDVMSAIDMVSHQPAVLNFKDMVKKVTGTEFLTERMHRDINTAITHHLLTKPGSPLYESSLLDDTFIIDNFLQGGIAELFEQMTEVVGASENPVLNTFQIRTETIRGVEFTYLDADPQKLKTQAQQNRFVAFLQSMIEDPDMYNREVLDEETGEYVEEDYSDIVVEFVGAMTTNAIITTGFHPRSNSYFQYYPKSYWEEIGITPHFNAEMRKLQEDPMALADFLDTFLENYGSSSYDSRFLFNRKRIAKESVQLREKSNQGHFIIRSIKNQRYLFQLTDIEKDPKTYKKTFVYDLVYTKGRQHVLYEAHIRSGSPGNYSKRKKGLINVVNSVPIAPLLDDVRNLTRKSRDSKSYGSSGSKYQVKKIISGGQTGSDRIGLEVGRALGITTGGVAPKGYKTEVDNDMSLADFGLTEDSLGTYSSRTKKNVASADLTLIFSPKENSAGTVQTIRFARQLGKKFLLNPTKEEIVQAIVTSGAEVINVAGNRASKMTKEQQIIIENTLKEAISDPRLHTKSQRVGTAQEETLVGAEDKINRLRSNFIKAGITATVVRGTLPKGTKGQVQGTNIVLDPNQMETDTVYHEFGHILIDMLPKEMVDKYIENVRKLHPQLCEKVEREYPELNDRDLGIEQLVTAIGMEGAKIHRKNPSKIQILINKILRAIGRVFGIEPDAAAVLAEQMFAGEIRNVGVVAGQSTKIWKSKDLQSRMMDVYKQVKDSLVRELVKNKRMARTEKNDQRKLELLAAINNIEDIRQNVENKAEDLEAFYDFQQFVVSQVEFLRNSIQNLKDTQNESLTKDQMFDRLNHIMDLNEMLAGLYNPNENRSTVSLITDLLDRLPMSESMDDEVLDVLDDLRLSLRDLKDIAEDYHETVAPMTAQLLAKYADPVAYEKMEARINRVIADRDISGYKLSSISNRDPDAVALRAKYKELKRTNPSSYNYEDYVTEALELKVKQMKRKLMDTSQIEAELTEAQKNKSVFSHLLDPFIYSSQQTLQMFAKVIKEAIETARESTLDFMYKMDKVYTPFIESMGGDLNPEKIHEQFITTIKVPKFKPDGSKEYIEVLAFRQLYDNDKFYKARAKFFSELAEKMDKPDKNASAIEKSRWWAVNRQTWAEEVAKWHDENTEKIPTAEAEYGEMIARINAIDQKIKMLEVELNPRNREEIGLLNAERSELVQKQRDSAFFTETGVVYMGSLAKPKLELYKDEKFEEIANNPAALKYYEFLINSFHSAQKTIGKTSLFVNSWDEYSYQIPSVRKGLKDQVARGEWREVLAEQRDQHTKSLETDVEFGQMTDQDGQPIQGIPIFFTNPVDHKLISRDLATTMVKFTYMAENFKEKSKVAGVVDAMTHLVESRGVLKESDSGRNATSLIASMGRGALEYITKYGAEEDRNLAHLKEFIDVNFYGQLDLNEKIFGYSAAKLAGMSTQLTSAASLSINTLQIANQAVLDNLMIAQERVAGEFFEGARWGWANGVLIENGLGLMDIGKPVPGTKLGKAVQFFNALVDAELGDERFTKSYVQQFFTSNTLFFAQHGIEYQTAATRMLALLDSVTPEDADGNTFTNEKGEVANLWDMLIEDENGALKIDPRVANVNKIDITHKLHAMSKRMNQIKGNFDRSTLQRSALGKLLLLFRNYFIPGFRRRWGHGDHEHVDHELGAITKGYYWAGLQALMAFFNHYFKGQHEGGLYSQLSKEEKADVRRAAFEVMAFISSYVIYAMFANMADDDDESYIKPFIAYQARRLQTELGGFADPREVFRTIQRPMAAANWYDALFNAVGMGLKTSAYGAFGWYEDEVKYQRRSGAYNKGDFKLQQRIEKIMPMLNGWNSAFWAEGSEKVVRDKLRWFE